MRNKLGEYITELRTGKGWSQSELARRAQTSPTQIQRLEKNELQSPGFMMMIALSKTLQAPLETLAAAYQGLEPLDVKRDEWQDLEPYLLGLVQHLPKRLIAQAIIQQEGKEKVREWVMEILNEKEDMT